MTADTTPSPTKGPSLVDRLRATKGHAGIVKVCFEAASYITELEGRENERADQTQEVVAALYKAWPDAEDIPSDWPLGIIGCIEQIIAEREAAEANARRLEEALSELIQHFEAGDQHDEGAFDAECPDCAVLAKARAAHLTDLQERLTLAGTMLERERARAEAAEANARRLEEAGREAAAQLHRIMRAAEMSSGIMLDKRRTGNWPGARNTADAFDRIGLRAAETKAAILAALTTKEADREAL